MPYHIYNDNILTYYMSKKIIITFLIMFLSFSCKKTENNNISNEPQLVALTESDLRPFYHFTPLVNWMNDPNGLVCYNGIYHLFYQYNPAGNIWGTPSWGHASSGDLFAWQDLPVAIPSDTCGIFSGSAVVDVNNTSGLQSGSQSVMIAIYTDNSSIVYQNQCIAYSNDAGTTWTKYSGNPVISNTTQPNFRDPKVFWYQPGQKWVMALADGNQIMFYGSPDLKNWTYLSAFGQGYGAHGGVWECPDLFQLNLQGTNTYKWVLMVSCNPGGPNNGSATQYFIGNFDGKTFTADNSNTSWIDYGMDDYAGNTYNNIPANDGRRIFIGWMSNWLYAGSVPTTTWRSTMTIPRVLTLANTGESLLINPVTEIQNYETGTPYTTSSSVDSVSLTNNSIIQSASYEIDFSVNFSIAQSVTLTIGNSAEQLKINFNKSTALGTIDRSRTGQLNFNASFAGIMTCPFVPISGQLTNFQIFIDKTSVEVFTNEGALVMSALFFPYYQYYFLHLSTDENSSAINNFSLKAINQSMRL